LKFSEPTLQLLVVIFRRSKHFPQSPAVALIKPVFGLDAAFSFFPLLFMLDDLKRFF
jgi:hypothetical protein